MDSCPAARSRFTADPLQGGYMKNRHCVPWLALFLAAAFSAPTYGGQLSLGFLSFDPGTGNTGVFDIVNMTGPNDTTFPDTSFPVATPVTFFDLLLTVDFVGGGSTTLTRLSSLVTSGVSVHSLLSPQVPALPLLQRRDVVPPRQAPSPPSPPV